MATKRQAKFEVLSKGAYDFDGDYAVLYWFFRLKAPNGKIVLQSETYKSRAMALKGIAAIKKYAADAPISEVE